MEIVEFLTTCLAEDERIALKSVEQAAVNLNGADPASVADWHVLERPATGTFVATRDQWDRVTEIVPTYGGAHSEHIAEHDPARVLREVDSKRQLLALHRRVRAEDVDWSSCPECGHQAWPCRTLRLLALPYAGREGYRAEWAPTE